MIITKTSYTSGEVHKSPKANEDYKRATRNSRLSCPRKVKSRFQEVHEGFGVCVSTNPKIPPRGEVRIIREALALCNILELRVCAEIWDAEDGTKSKLNNMMMSFRC
jgi:hypothetical protein